MKFTAPFALCAAAGSALAAPSLGPVDHSNHTILNAGSYTAQALDAVPFGSNPRGGAATTIFSNMEAGAGFQAFPESTVNLDGATESIGFDDYTSIASGTTQITEFRFVGGVAQAGGVMFVDFFDSSGAALDGFGIQLADAGNFIYTITVSTAVDVADVGFVQISLDDDGLFADGVQTTGQWFLSAEAATIGANGPDGGASAGALNHNFELTTVPAPSAAALLGLGGLIAGRRRR
ncbi:MAG: hypothetical protein AAGA55_05315 [Planctomycetota bacterium]